MRVCFGMRRCSCNLALRAAVLQNEYCSEIVYLVTSRCSIYYSHYSTSIASREHIYHITTTQADQLLKFYFVIIACFRTNETNLKINIGSVHILMSFQYSTKLSGKWCTSSRKQGCLFSRISWIIEFMLVADPVDVAISVSNVFPPHLYRLRVPESTSHCFRVHCPRWSWSSLHWTQWFNRLKMIKGPALGNPWIDIGFVFGTNSLSFTNS